MDRDPTLPDDVLPPAESDTQPDQHCPVCSATLFHEKCKVICRSPKCVYRIIFNCAEF